MGGTNLLKRYKKSQIGVKKIWVTGVQAQQHLGGGGHKNFVIEEVQKVWKTLSYAFIIIIADPLDTDRILLNKYLWGIQLSSWYLYYS